MAQTEITYNPNDPNDNFSVTIHYDDAETIDDTSPDHYWHIYRGDLPHIAPNGHEYARVFVTSIGNSPISNHKDIPATKTPHYEIDGKTVPFVWITTLDHRPSEEEWDSFF